jgi:hypothetical protein
MPTKPRGPKVERNEAKRECQRAATDLAGAGRGARRRRESPERVGLGFQPRERESEGGG